MNSDKIAILDAGSQYGKLIDRRVRELHCCSELLPLDTPLESLENSYKGIIISGGPNSFQAKDAPMCDPSLLNSSIPILGICYGMQWLGLVFGGQVKGGKIREDGQIPIEINPKDLLFAGLEEKQLVLLTHGDSVHEISNDLEVIARSPNHIAGIKHTKKPFYGVQFHPEVDLTVNGKKILENFLLKICLCSGDYKIEDRLQKAVDEIRSQVQEKNVVVLASGGVDSTVCCALLYKALGQQKVHAIHINNGFMRMKEDALVKEALEKIGFTLQIVDASKEFLNGTTEIEGKKFGPLHSVVNPEEKRKIIGDTFIKVIMKEIQNLSLNNYFLAQGTLRPDLIESASHLASSKADVIKTHHNDTALVREKRKEGLIIEPLKDYHKDEVRQLGRLLGLPEHLVGRHPFPGPGLAIRIICLDEPYKTKDFDIIDQGLREIALKQGFEAVLLPIKSVGVQGDGRSYSYVAALSGKEKENWNKLFELAKEIPKTFHQINRVVYVFGDIDREKISVTKTFLVEETIQQLKEADFIANELLFGLEQGLIMKKISQVPIVLIPISFDEIGQRSIVLRPIITNDFMTGAAAIPGIDIPSDALNEIAKEIIKKTKGISRVLLDLTSKPPGTTEWE